MLGILCGILLFFLQYDNAVTTNNFEWILYSHNGYDNCLLYDQRLFCRDHDLLSNNLSSYTQGTTWYFSTLKDSNTTTDDLLKWRIPFETIERYAEYLDNNSTNSFICNCTHDLIGTVCQYLLPANLPTIAELWKDQLRDPAARETGFHTCLVDMITCNTGVLCLEWRQVCDGIIQCENGSDEIGCHEFELRNCSSDEFQCRNSMCIPNEFLFDGAFDCMDSSDEQEVDKIKNIFGLCPTPTMWECDERLCRKDEFSCGDGQCIHWSNLIHHQNSCKNTRDLAYQCELQAFPTLANGFCRQKGNAGLPPLQNSTSCSLGLRYLLIGYQRKQSWNHIVTYCPAFIQYPEQPVLSPVLKMFYNISRIVSFYAGQNFGLALPKRTPDLVCLNGTFICNGTLITSTNGTCWSFENYLSFANLPFFPFSYLFCQMVENQLQNNLLRENSQPLIMNSKSFICNEFVYPMAIRRINDGYIDCLFGEDEQNDQYNITIPYRYRCSDLSITQYVSYQLLGNGIEECADGTDELSNALNWHYFRCDFGEEYPCWVFRSAYIDNIDRINSIQLPFHRYCDSVRDTRDGHDEKNCSQWVCPQDMYQCRTTGQCINKDNLCDGDFDCDNGEDELNCSITKSQWVLEAQCNNTKEHFCITQHFLNNQTLHRPCIDYWKAGDGQLDCMGGRDERNVFVCPDHHILGDRFLCDNATKCLSHTVVCNGIIDCYDQTDERICFWTRHRCIENNFACYDNKTCTLDRCSSKNNCPTNENLFWCPNPYESNYRISKVRRRSNYLLFCGNVELLNTSTAPVSGIPVNSIANPQFRGYCNRGFYLLSGNGKEPVCFCPPSFYGHRCQYDRLRITIRIRFDRRHRSDLPPLLHVLVILLHNRTFIIDHQRFVDIDEEFPQKHKAYLIYSYPNLSGNYSVQFQAYDGLELLSVWEYSINTIGILPVFQLAKILRFPDRSLPWRCLHNHCQNNGSCYIIVNNDENNYFCLCQRGWKGNHCTEPLKQNKCSLHALALDEDLCVCQHGYLSPHCFVCNTICEKQTSIFSSTNGICLPFPILPPHEYWYFRDSSTSDGSSKSMLMLNRRKPNEEAFLLQLLKIYQDYPKLRQQMLIPKLTSFPISFIISTRDLTYNITLPEIGLLYTYGRQRDFVAVHLSMLYINCSNSLRNFTADLNSQPTQCKSISTRSPMILLNTFCWQSEVQSCFYSQNYICYCKRKTNRSECLSYEQRDVQCGHCLNQGYCIQGNLRNSSDFACVCPKCVLGDLCQFATSRFSIELEMLIEQTQGNRLHLLVPIIFFCFGMIFNTLEISTFMKQNARQAGAGLYLLINGFISQFVLALLLTRVIYLIFVKQMTLSLITNQILCKSLPYLMTTLKNISMWLMSFVTVERALAVTWPLHLRMFRTPRFAKLVSIVTLIFLFSSLYMLIIEYKIVIRPDRSYISCVREIPSHNRITVQYTSLAHQLIPFLLNFIAGITVIINLGRSKAHSHQKPSRYTIAEQARQRADLLIGPFICFVSALPQLIILFLDACNYEENCKNIQVWKEQ
ncbi:unnamed protein product [Adineta steineri]|uniref:Uncharacterized protein n=1 Tax=Adineta steineri TaxID=433720 RepID=A0A819UKL4_9BILA|nr:unnamed protein product [Adineta steineri]